MSTRIDWVYGNCFLVVVATLAVSPRTPQPAAAQAVPNRVERAADWRLETVRTTDGKSYQGLILEERADALEFAEIVREPGKSMFTVVRNVNAQDVARIDRLNEEDRAVLVQRYEKYKNRFGIELGQMESVELAEVERDGVEYRTYAGNWFELWSTADDEMTRRCVVRIEQIFRAYRQVFPSRNERDGKLQIRLYGSIDQYRGYLQRLGVEIDNPAFYAASQNLIVAGSDLSRYSQRLTQIRRENEELRRFYREVLNPAFASSLRQLSRELERKGMSLQELQIRRAAWDNELKGLERRIIATNRRNEAKFAEVTTHMFTRLYHEAFHAYLENYVYPRHTWDMPRWLNEGLAQVFEGGQLEADTLRVDAPRPRALQRLQAHLAGPQPLSLAQLLTADENAFLVTHAGGSSQEHYLYSWGVAYYLTFQQDLLGGGVLDWYVSREARQMAPIARFEKLVGRPLPEFEKRWRKAMRALEPPRTGLP